MNVRLSLPVMLASAWLPACCLTPAGEPQPDGGNGPAACVAAGGSCLIGPPTNCYGTVLQAFDCNPPPVNPGGAICCLPVPDAGPPMTCAIGGSTYTDGTRNPMNPCQSCHVAIDQSNWTSLAAGTPCFENGLCSDGFCTKACLIDGGIVLSGTTKNAGCQQCVPSSSLTSWTNADDGTACQVHDSKGEICYSGTCRYACLISGVLYSADDVNGLSPCLSCQPIVSTSGWSDLPNGTPCGVGSVCNPGGSCGSSPGCNIGGVNYPSRAANPSDPSQCCEATLDGGATWSVRLALGQTLSLPYSESILAVGDFNGDGQPDLAVSSPQDNQVTIFLNLAGSLVVSQTYSVGLEPRSMVAADLNGDGLSDLITENGTDQTLSVLVSRGDGTFEGPFTYPSGAGGYNVLAAGVLDGRGTPDLLCSVAGGLLLYVGTGDGGLGPGEAISQPEHGSLAVADFNRDGALDIALGDFSHGGLSILLGEGDGGFRPATNYADQNQIFQIAADDFNGDGFVDLAIATGAGGLLELYAGRGDGTFAMAATSNGWGYSVCSADLVGDGTRQVLVSKRGGETGQLVLADGGGWVGTLLGPQTDSFALAAADFNGDGAQDLAVATSTGVSIYINGCP